MNQISRTLLIFATSAICVFLSIDTQAQISKFTVDGVQREALIFAPSKPSASPERFPVLFALHGYGGTMQEAAAGMRFQSLWPEAIVVYMQGLRTKISVDPLGFYSGWQQEPDQFGDRDLKFFDVVLMALRMRFPVDDKRIYATGLSNGGIFTYLLWGARSAIFAGFALVAARKFPAVWLAIPKPVLHIAGEHDNVIPFNEQLHSIRIARDLNDTASAGESCGECCTTYPSRNGAPRGYLYPPWWPCLSERRLADDREVF